MLSGEVVQFQTRSWEFEQEFKSNILATLSDLNLVVGILNFALMTNTKRIKLFVSFCEQKLSEKNSKLIVENIYGKFFFLIFYPKFFFLR